MSKPNHKCRNCGSVKGYFKDPRHKFWRCQVCGGVVALVHDKGKKK